MKKQRKHYTPEEKVAILRRHLLEKEPISKLCDELGLQPTVFYRWQKEFFENGAAAFEQKARPNHSADQERIAYLGKKIQTKDEVLVELMAEHVALRKNAWGTTSHPAGNNEPILTIRDTARYRALLLAKREELAAQAEGAESLVPPANDKSGDLIDWARADTEAELQIQRRESDAHLIRAIEDALRRINRGSFGVCEVCKQPISRARLEAVPWTRTCRDCKQEQSRTAGKSG
jgi:RNA polymerase-binding protein DksA